MSEQERQPSEDTTPDSEESMQDLDVSHEEGEDVKAGGIRHGRPEE